MPLMKQLFDVVLQSKYGRSGAKSTKKLPRSLRAKLTDGEVLVGLNLIREDADMLRVVMAK